MRFLSRRPVRSTVSIEDIPEKHESILRNGEILWEESGFSVGTQGREGFFQKKDGTNHFKQTYGPIQVNYDETKALTISNSINDATPTYLYNSDGTIEAWIEKIPNTSRKYLDTRKEVARAVLQHVKCPEGPIDEWFEKLSATPSESRCIREKVARVVLQSLMSEDDPSVDETDEAEDRYNIEVGHEKYHNEVDKYGVPENIQSITMSALESNTFDACERELEAADDVQQERERIRDFFFRSISENSAPSSKEFEISHDLHNESEWIREASLKESSPRATMKSDISSVGNFWVLMGFTCCLQPQVPMTPKPISHGATLHFLPHSISKQFSSLSH